MVRPKKRELRAVGKGVLDGVIVEVLIDRVAAIVAAAQAHRLNRPGVLHPAALVDAVDVEVAEAAAAGPEEAVEPLDLVEQLADALRLRRRGEGAGRPVHPVAPHGKDFAQLARADAVVEFDALVAVAGHQAHAHLEVLAGRTPRPGPASCGWSGRRP